MKTYLLPLGAAVILAGCARGGEEPTPRPALASEPTIGQEFKAVVQNKVTVTFADGSDRLTPEANGQLDLAARLFRDVHPVMMFAIGYSDATGKEFDNVILSAKRARAVKEALVARGIPADHLTLQALGQSDPIDGNRPLDPDNRRVTVMWRIV